MNRFTLAQLLDDASIYGPDLKYQFQSLASYQKSRVDMIHFLVDNLIGSDHYDLMLRHPNMVIVFKEINDNVKYGQYLAYNW